MDWTTLQILLAGLLLPAFPTVCPAHPAAAKLLKAREAELPGTIVLLFQPGEESLGGAVDMIAEVSIVSVHLMRYQICALTSLAAEFTASQDLLCLT